MLVDFGTFSHPALTERKGRYSGNMAGNRPTGCEGEVHTIPQESATLRGNTRVQTKKNPNSEELGFHVWWSWGDLNPRPQAFFAQFYMCSRLIWVSPDASRSDTLRTRPATLNLVTRQVARLMTSPCKFPCSLDNLTTALAQPIGQLLQGSPD